MKIVNELFLFTIALMLLSFVVGMVAAEYIREPSLAAREAKCLEREKRSIEESREFERTWGALRK